MKKSTNADDGAENADGAKDERNGAREHRLSRGVLNVLVKTLLNMYTPSPSLAGISLGRIMDFFKGRKSLEEQQMEVIRKVLESDIDPQTFDILLSNGINRKLKVRFGYLFLFFTFLFTAGSYTIVILDGICEWNISEVAITALIIETPIQFIGLLYIIARNLFPQKEERTELRSE